jgi:lipoteichoic acid synthase
MKKNIHKINKKTRKKIIEYVFSNRLFLSYVFLMLLGTCFLRLLTVGHFFAWKPFIADIAWIILIGAIGYFIKPEKQYKYYKFWCITFTVIEIVNVVYYKFFYSFVSFGELATFGQTETVMGSIFDKINPIDFIFILFPYTLSKINKSLEESTYYNVLNKIEKSKTMVTTTLVIGLIFLGVTLSTATGTDYSRLSNQWNRIYVVQRFGIIMYQGNDLIQTLTPKINSIFGYDEAKQSFDNFFSTEKTIGEDNKYTGILKDKNIVFIHMESMEDFVMNLSYHGVDVAPNLTKLSKDGMFFENFYPEISTGTSSDTEFTLLTSLMPAASGTVFVSYYNRNYITIPKLLANEGYTTFSMHGNYASMWNRAKAHPSLGYQHMYFRDTFQFTNDDILGLGLNDSLFFKEAIPKIENIEANNKNYMGTVITLSNHSPFVDVSKYSTLDLSSTFTDETGNTKTTDFLSDRSIGRYLKSVHYADTALGEFIDLINNSSAFDNTIFVFYGDHDAKFSHNELNYLYNYDYKTGELKAETDPTYKSYDSIDHELNKKTPLIIWTKNSALKNTLKGKISYPMGMIDVSPTILNMYGIKNKYALGHDIFDTKKDNVVIFPNGNFLTNNLYYNNSTGTYKTFKENTILDENYIKNLNEYTEKRLRMSNSIIVYNLLDSVNKEEVYRK